MSQAKAWNRRCGAPSCFALTPAGQRHSGFPHGRMALLRLRWIVLLSLALLQVSCCLRQGTSDQAKVALTCLAAPAVL